MIKQRQQLAASPVPISTMFSDVIHREGFGQLYRSLSITLMMNVPWHFVQVATNETIKRLYCPSKDHTFTSYFCCAAIAGTPPPSC